MKRPYRPKPRKEVLKAKREILEYFDKAKKSFSKDKKLANDYVRKARRLAMKFKIRLSSSLQKRFCKHCYAYLVPSKNCRVRLQKSKVVYYCLNCKKFMRFPYKK